jgi:hypothetical protein
MAGEKRKKEKPKEKVLSKEELEMKERIEEYNVCLYFIYWLTV